MSYETLQLHIDGAVARLTIDRPEHANAMTLEMGREMVAALDRLQAESGVRVLLLTGAGQYFCAGADMAEFLRMQNMSSDEIRKHADQLYFSRAIQTMHEMDIPVVARINGDAYGGGAGLTLACDLRVMSSNARLGFIFPRVGISSADAGATYFLPRLVGMARATEILLLGQEIGSAAALEMNLVHRVAPADELDQVTEELLSRLAAAAPIATRYTKQALTKSFGSSITEELAFERQALAACLLSDDHLEGVQAQLDKRLPVFKGK